MVGLGCRCHASQHRQQAEHVGAQQQTREKPAAPSRQGEMGHVRTGGRGVAVSGGAGAVQGAGVRLGRSTTKGARPAAPPRPLGPQVASRRSGWRRRRRSGGEGGEAVQRPAKARLFAAASAKALHSQKRSGAGPPARRQGAGPLALCKGRLPAPCTRAERICRLSLAPWCAPSSAWSATVPAVSALALRAACAPAPVRARSLRLPPPPRGRADSCRGPPAWGFGPSSAWPQQALAACK